MSGTICAKHGVKHDTLSTRTHSNQYPLCNAHDARFSQTRLSSLWSTRHGQSSRLLLASWNVLKSPTKPLPYYSAAALMGARKRKRDNLGLPEQSGANDDVTTVQEKWHKGKDGLMAKRIEN
jgi:hypothetical protein